MAVMIARLFGKGHLPIAKVLRTLQVEFITQICSKISNYADPKEIAKQTSNAVGNPRGRVVRENYMFVFYKL